MRIVIPFNDWSKKRLKAKRKVVTSRSKAYGRPGDIFFDGEMKFELLAVTQMPLWFVVRNLFAAEGADSPDELIEVWKSIHRGNYDDQKIVYAHFFAELVK